MKIGFWDEYVHTKKRIKNPEDERVLTDDLTAVWKGHKIVVKAGYRTDGASIPRLMWRVVGHPWGAYLPAAIVHDVLYETEAWSREQADKCFRDLMEALGIGRLRRAAMYRAVRIGGGIPWNRHTPATIARAEPYLEISNHA